MSTSICEDVKAYFRNFLISACVDTGSNRSPSVYLEKKISMTDVFDFKRSNDDITMRFDTSSSTGLMLQVEGGPNEYIILTVEDGKIVFKIKYGTGMKSSP